MSLGTLKNNVAAVAALSLVVAGGAAGGGPGLDVLSGSPTTLDREWDLNWGYKPDKGIKNRNNDKSAARDRDRERKKAAHKSRVAQRRKKAGKK